MPGLSTGQLHRTKNEGKGPRFGPPQTGARDARPRLRRPDATNRERPKGSPATLRGQQGAGPSGARLGRRCRSRSLVRQSCLNPRSPVSRALARTPDDRTSGQARSVSLGPRRDNAAPTSLRSALPPAVPFASLGTPSAFPGLLRWDFLVGEAQRSGDRVAWGQLKPTPAIPITHFAALPPLVQSRPLSSVFKGLRRAKTRACGELDLQDSANPAAQGGRSPLEIPPGARARA
jgi:hypothetical protein